MIQITKTSGIELTKGLIFSIHPRVSDDDENFHLSVSSSLSFLKMKVNHKAFRTFVQAVKTWDGKGQIVQVGPVGERYRMSTEKILTGLNKRKHLSLQKNEQFLILACANKKVYENLAQYLVENCLK